MKQSDRVLLGHGSGGRLTQQLVREIFLRFLGNPALERLEDAALIPLNDFCSGGASRLSGLGPEDAATCENCSRLSSPPSASRLARSQGPAGASQLAMSRLAMTTDSFVVDPVIFAGGDIGKLAVCGTVNDLLVMGARPVALSAGYILEEGFPLATLEQIVQSMGVTARSAGVDIVTGDTKVVPRGKADGCFINTAGIGMVLPEVEVGGDKVEPGDWVVISGPIGEHGAAIMAGRAGIELRSPIVSDCAPLTPLILPLLEAPQGLHAMRDPTRGGLGTTICEIADASRVHIQIEEAKLPVSNSVRAACELLGIDPLFLACEGRVLLLATPEAAQRALKIFQEHPIGKGAAIIGEVQAGGGGSRVTCKTIIGSHRMITMPAADPLPRIC